MFPHASSPDPPPILPIPLTDSPVSPLAPPLAVDPVLDQTPDLPPAAPIAPPPVLNPILDQTPDLPLTAPPFTSLVSPQEPAPPMDLVTDHTPPLPLRRSNQVKAPLAHLRDYS